MDEIRDFVGKRIRDIREERGITQKELGEVLGYSAMGISHFEKGIRDIKLSDLKKIAQYFSKDLSFFLSPTFFRFSGKDNPEVQKSLEDFDNYLDQQKKDEQ